MKLLCWNIRGFGLPGRRRQLIEYMRQEEIDIVGLHEMICQDFSMHEFQRLSRHQFSWQWLPASGHFGGILLVVREDAFSVQDMDRGEFFLSMAITDRRVHLSWEVIIVYGPVDHGRSAEFLAELKNKVDRCTTPVVVAGDFNLIRWASHKSSPNVDRPRMCLFNDCIADMALREIARVGARFTWSNKQADPIQSVLDRVFVSPQWEVMFPLCGLKAVMQIGSDHTPLLFSSGDGSPPRSRRFRFETFWLEQPGFCELVRDRWHLAAASPPRVFCAVDVWQHCAKMARQAMKGWGANLGADLRARKGALLGQIKTLDDLADGSGLSRDDWTRRYSLDAELMDIFRSEELFWQRRGDQNWLLKGDANTAYFQAIANGRRRKCVIPFLWDGGALLENPQDISSHIYSFYKELFSAELRGGSSLCEDFWLLADQVSDVENAELTLPFSPEEVGWAIASMKACSAPGPDGLPVVFFSYSGRPCARSSCPCYSEAEHHRIADNLNFKLAAFPISYLGMPLAESKILVSGFDPLVGRVASRAKPWCGRFTSKGSKSILISSNLASLPMYMMGMYILPEGVHNAFDKELARFFWQAGNGRPKYHMVKWADICVPKDRGGLGIPASHRMNVALMLRRVWRILHGDGGFVASID
ncbi:hypothetical protein D1007_06305 [Hordeum vulgare]|nr:hypothetical protein D1007_06305 [Hordeum vulgare]